MWSVRDSRLKIAVCSKSQITVMQLTSKAQVSASSSLPDHAVTCALSMQRTQLLGFLHTQTLLILSSLLINLHL